MKKKWIISGIFLMFGIVSLSEFGIMSFFIFSLGAILINPKFTDFLQRRNLVIKKNVFISLLVAFFIGGCLTSPASKDNQSAEGSANGDRVIVQIESVQNDGVRGENNMGGDEHDILIVTSETAEKTITMPAPEPTPEKTPEPTAESTPIITPEPTAESTPIITPEPTVAPTRIPTSEPTAEPTPILTPAPTVEPTLAPTPEPTTTPKPTSSADSNHSSSGGTTVKVPDHSETGNNLVWVPTNGGTKYHRKSSCSKMIDPIQVTKETAIENGYEACGHCY